MEKELSKTKNIVCDFTTTILIKQNTKKELHGPTIAMTGVRELKKSEN